MPAPRPARHWVFTVFGEFATEDGLVRFQQKIETHKTDTGIRYLIGQVELCPDTDRLHIQGYVEFTRPKRRRAVVAALADGCHVEPRQGSRDSARDYARKEETRKFGPIEIGTWITGQGSREDLAALHQSLQAGTSFRDISNEHFGAFIRYSRGITLWRVLNTPRRNWKPQVWVFYGPTGTGKTQAAWSMAPDAFLLSPQQSSSGTGWWDGYDGHENVIVDEFYGWLRWNFLLQLLDRYPLRVECKGGSHEFVGKRIIFTSNKPPSVWYDPVKIDWSPLKRRIDFLYECLPDVWNRIPL